MDRTVTLSPLTRQLTRVSAIAFAVVGLIFFVAPGFSAENFPWNVSPFVAMTIGAWCLGSAAIAWEAARIWRFGLVYALLVFLWLFAIAELLVVVAFLGALRTTALLTIPYLLTLGLAVASALSGVVDLVRRRPPLRVDGHPKPTWVQALILTFGLLVGILAVGGLFAGQGGLSTTGGIFPEPLTLFTVRAFAAFFLALDLAALALLLSPWREPAVELARVGIALIVPILVAAAVNIGAFDFAARPGGLLYIGAYVLTLVLAVWSVARFDRLDLGVPREQTPDRPDRGTSAAASV